VSLSDVFHQPYAQALIQRAVVRGRVPHAYLFHGPDGVGKESLALGFAQLMLCDQPVDRHLVGEHAALVGRSQMSVGCGACVACRAVNRQTHPDLHLIYRQLNREHPEEKIRKRKALDIGVDVLRHFVIGRVGLTPIHGRAKVFIIREADRITPGAQNALLKTLEEPPGTTFLILLASSVDRLLPTTLSRCQVVQFDALPTEFVRGRLRSARPDLGTEWVDWYARVSDGSLGRALEYAGDDLSAVNNRLLERFARLIASQDERSNDSESDADARSDKVAAAWLDEAKALGERYRTRDADITDTEAGRRGLQAICHLAASWHADVLRLTNGDTVGLVNAPSHREIEVLRPSIGTENAIRAIQRIAAAEHHLNLNVHTQLCIETLLDDLVRLAGRQVAHAH
jgi:DNA polymerase-3 subunit delta'